MLSIQTVFKNTEGASSSFTDVPEGSMFYKMVSWAAKNDITAGVGNNMFGVNDEVNCEDFVVWLYKADKLEAPAETPSGDRVGLLRPLLRNYGH